MAATQVQGIGAGKAVLGDQTQTLSYPSPPTQGNLLACLANVDNAFTATMSSAGWTKVDQTGPPAGHGGVAMFWKIAEEGESQDVILDYGEVNRRGGMIIYEYSNPAALALDQFSAVYDGTSDNDKSTGTTAILSGDAVLALTVVSLADDNANLAGTSWTNGFVGDLAAESFFQDMFSAVLDLDGSDETLETTATYNGTPEAGTAALMVFKAASAGGLASFRDAVATDAVASDAAAADAEARDVGA